MSPLMLVSLIIFIEAFLLYRLFKRMRFHPFPHGILIYLMLGKLILWVSYQGILTYDFLRIWSSYAHITYFQEVIFLLFALFLFYFISSLGISINLKQQSLEKWDIKPSIWTLIITFLWIRLLYHISILNFDILMANNEYLLMSSMQALNTEHALARFVQQSNKFFGLIVTVIWAFLCARKKWGLMLFVSPLLIWHFLFELAGHSRYAALYMFTIAGVYSAVNRRRSLSVISLFTVLGLTSLFFVLAGRVSGEHGFTSLFMISDKIASIPYERAASNALANGFEGLYIVSELFSAPRYFDDIYKRLSLSPFPSFIDGFAHIRAANEIRLHDYVPMGAIAEIIHFGAIYTFIYFFIQLLSIRISFIVMQKIPGVMAVVFNMILLVASYLQFTYSTRTVFRFYIIVLIIGLGMLFFQNMIQRLPKTSMTRSQYIKKGKAVPLGAKPSCEQNAQKK